MNGKGIIPYEKIISANSLDIKPKNNYLFEKSEFYSELKKVASYEDYENSKFLYLTFKMRNLNDMNDSYNAQDVILLCKLKENRFELMCHRYFLIQRIQFCKYSEW